MNLTRIFRKKASVYGNRPANRILVEPNESKRFSIEPFPEEEILNRVRARSEEVRAKIEGGELDSANVGFICLCYATLIEEAEAEIRAWKGRAQIELLRLLHSLEAQKRAEEIALGKTKTLNETLGKRPAPIRSAAITSGDEPSRAERRGYDGEKGD